MRPATGPLLWTILILSPLSAAPGAEPTASAPEAGPQSSRPREAEGRKPAASLPLSVKLALLADPRTFPYEIEVSARGAELTLSGAVSSEEERRAAAAIARQVEGVAAVVNELMVAPELARTLAQRLDEAITRYLRERFKASATLQAAGFEVQTKDGVVSLSGRTRFQVIMLEAAEAARRVPGVKAVRTEGIRIEPGE